MIVKSPSDEFNESKLLFRLFEKEDFAEYRRWFEDTLMNRYLGPMEEEDEWLDAVLYENSLDSEGKGRTYSVLQEEEFLAVVGVVMPNSVHPYFVITSIAINPQARRNGLGSSVLAGLLSMFTSAQKQIWKVYVSRDNRGARLFFMHNGWRMTENKNANGTYICYELHG